MPIRIGFVGTGGIAQAHFDALSQIEEAQPIAFCDIEAERAERAAQRFNGRAYTNWRAMLDNETLDALYICVPPHGHDGAEEAAAERGIHLFIEKPVARTLEQAKRIEAAIKQAGVLSMVGYHFRYYGAIERAKERLQGLPVLMVKGAWDGGMPCVPWWRKHECSGGQLVEQT
ncbi:MAG: Gfo/Idh/MocA family oxidoreductase, partial [Fimbriimonadales bacterium]|nr:Gfo/Idh/MocA family oxidoreductase [Fimbriimonadales bacterium]